MIVNRNRELEEYFKEIRSYLPISRTEQQRIIKRIEGDLKEFLYDHPNATIEDLKHRFGSPEMIAENYLDSFNDVEMHKNIIRRKRFWYLLATTALALFLIGAAFVINFFLMQNQDLPKYYIVEKGINSDAILDEVMTVSETVIISDS